MLVAAPAGYGKTTAVAQWRASSDTSRAFAWVSLDAGDNDPARLWSHILQALYPILPRMQERVSGLLRRHGENVEQAVLPELIDTLGQADRRLVLLLDDFHCLTEMRCQRQVDFLLHNLPPLAQLVIVTRADPLLHLGRLRVEDQLLEIRVDELRFGPDEASALLATHGVRLSDPALGRLVAATEGWPAALSLAALSLAGRSDADHLVDDLAADNRYIGDYLTEEVLEREGEAVRRFVYCASILERFNAPLCDFLLGTSDSQTLIERIEHSNLFLVPLDGEGGWFRFHNLFATVARARLAAAEPDLVPTLHRRAVEWFSREGLVDEAVEHALAVGDVDATVALVTAHRMRYVTEGRILTLHGWLRALGRPALDANPAAGVMTAWIAAVCGDLHTMEERLNALDPAPDIGPLPDGSPSVEFSIAMLRGSFGFDGPVEMLAAARRAVVLAPDEGSPWCASAHLVLGNALLLVGDDAGAEGWLRRVLASTVAPPLTRIAAFALLSFVELDRRHVEDGTELAETSLRIAQEEGFTDTPQASLAYTALGRARAETGHLEDALPVLEHGLALRRQMANLSPWPTIRHALVMAPVLMALGRPAPAHELVDEVDRLLGRWTGGTEALRDQLARVEEAMQALSRVRPRPVAEPLTDREESVLRLLLSRLTLREIAGELYVSHNTVKTHARMVYRKLGASSRAEAVDIARRRGLV